MNKPDDRNHKIIRRTLITRTTAVTADAVIFLDLQALDEISSPPSAVDALIFRVVRDIDILQTEFQFIGFRQTVKRLLPSGYGDSLVGVEFSPA